MIRLLAFLDSSPTTPNHRNPKGRAFAEQLSLHFSYLGRSYHTPRPVPCWFNVPRSTSAWNCCLSVLRLAPVSWMRDAVWNTIPICAPCSSKAANPL